MDPIASKMLRPSELERGWVQQLTNERPSKFGEVRKQIRTTDDIDPGVTVWRPEATAGRWSANGAKLLQLTRRVSALPKTSPFDSIRRRLADLGSQYQNIAGTIDAVSGSASPEQLLKLQKEMYQITENIGLTSKIIDQVTSGVRSLLQTQI